MECSSVEIVSYTSHTDTHATQRNKQSNQHNRNAMLTAMAYRKKAINEQFEMLHTNRIASVHCESERAEAITMRVHCERSDRVNGIEA